MALATDKWLLICALAHSKTVNGRGGTTQASSILEIQFNYFHSYLIPVITCLKRNYFLLNSLGNLTYCSSLYGATQTNWRFLSSWPRHSQPPSQFTCVGMRGDQGDISPLPLGLAIVKNLNRISKNMTNRYCHRLQCGDGERFIDFRVNCVYSNSHTVG